jgi:hypothetical protein
MNRQAGGRPARTRQRLKVARWSSDSLSRCARQVVGSFSGSSERMSRARSHSGFVRYPSEAVVRCSNFGVVQRRQKRRRGGKEEQMVRTLNVSRDLLKVLQLYDGHRRRYDFREPEMRDARISQRTDALLQLDGLSIERSRFQGRGGSNAEVHQAIVSASRTSREKRVERLTSLTWRTNETRSYSMAGRAG